LTNAIQNLTNPGGVAPAIARLNPDALGRAINNPTAPYKLKYQHLFEGIVEFKNSYVYIPNINSNEYDSNELPLSVYGIHIKSLLYQNHAGLTLENSIPSNNPNIFE
jgi:hypothetical protein